LYESIVPLRVVFNENTQRHYILGYILGANIPRVRQLKNFTNDYKLDDGYYKLTQDEINLIEEYYLKNYYENDDSNDSEKIYIVRFTELGLKQFELNTHGRPRTSSPKDAIIKSFTSTDKKMLSYFLKFGPNIEIQSPPNARELFKNVFKLSLRIYEDYNKLDN